MPTRRLVLTVAALSLAPWALGGCGGGEGGAAGGSAGGGAAHVSPAQVAPGLPPVAREAPTEDSRGADPLPGELPPGGDACPAPAPQQGGPTWAPQDIPSTGPVPAGCVRIEGGDIGGEGRVLTLAGRTVTLTDWVAKQGASGEWVGFSFTTTGGPVAYVVKAATGAFGDTQSPWLHPAGTRGRSAHAISNITFCPGEGGADAGTDAGTACPGDGGTGPGDAGTGDAGPGDAGIGDAGTGDAGAGDAGTGGDVGDSCTRTSDCRPGLVCSPDGLCEVPIG